MKSYVAAVLSIALILAQTVQATEIRQFDRFDDSDEVQFVSDLVASVKAEAQGDPALQEKVHRFFQKKQPGEAISGMGRFEMNISLARIADMDAAAKNPRSPRIQVEDVMYATLFDSGIRFTRSFRPTVVNFQPQKPLTAPSTRADAERALAQTREWVARQVQADRSAGTHGPHSGFGLSDTQTLIAFFAAMIALGIVLDHGKSASPGSTTSPMPSLPDVNQQNNDIRQAHRNACAATLTYPCNDPLGNAY